MAVPLTIDPRCYDAVILAVDGVVTDTSCVDATAWTQLFDDYLARWPAHESEDHSPFSGDDYRRPNAIDIECRGRVQSLMPGHTIEFS